MKSHLESSDPMTQTLEPTQEYFHEREEEQRMQEEIKNLEELQEIEERLERDHHNYLHRKKSDQKLEDPEKRKLCC